MNSSSNVTLSDGEQPGAPALPEQLLAFLQTLFDLAKPDARGLVRRETLRTLLLNYLEEKHENGERKIQEEQAQMLMGKYDSIGRSHVRFADLCGVFRALFASTNDAEVSSINGEANALLAKLQAELERSRCESEDMRVALERRVEEERRRRLRTEEESVDQVCAT